MMNFDRKLSKAFNKLLFESDDENRFITDLDNNPYDWDTRLIYADYLEENGRDNEAGLQRLLYAYRIAPSFRYGAWSMCFYYDLHNRGPVNPPRSAYDSNSIIYGDYLTAVINHTGVSTDDIDFAGVLEMHISNNGMMYNNQRHNPHRFNLVFHSRQDAEGFLLDAFSAGGLI